MNELGLDLSKVIPWFPHSQEDPYVLVRVRPEDSAGWATGLQHAVRRCYMSDEKLMDRVMALAGPLSGTPEFRQYEIISAQLPDPGSVMAGDFGEILIYIYLASKAPPGTIGAKKWRLKEGRTGPARYSDVVHFVLPDWPTPSARDELWCAEVKMKATDGGSTPIPDAITGCAKDRTSRLAKTLVWLKERAIKESLGELQIPHLDRFIKAVDHPPATKRFRAVAVVCSGLVDAELASAPPLRHPDYDLVVVAVPNLYAVYNAVFDAAKTSRVQGGPAP